MNDRYQQLASSQLGQRLLGALNLPVPKSLERASFESHSLGRLPVVVTACKQSALLRQVLKTLDGLDAQIQLLESTQSQFRDGRMLRQLRDVEWLRLDRLRDGKNLPIRALVFDATSIETSKGLDCLYQLFHSASQGLAEQSKVLIIGLAPQHCTTPEQAAVQEGLQGFVRSFSKEVGGKGSTVNLIQLERPEGRYDLATTLAFYLSAASAFVSGQSLLLRPGGRTAALPEGPEKPLAGKTALVTGASRGIGAAICRALAEQGATIIGLDINAQREALNQTIEPLGGKSLLMDLAVPEAAEALGNWLDAKGCTLDIVVHNAGITRDKTLRKMSPAFWTQVLEINLAAILRINSLLLEQQRLARDGRLILMSSVSGTAGNFGQTNYATAKAALQGLAARQADSLPRGVTINAIAPGFIETEMTAKIPVAMREIARRINALSQGGKPEDIAAAVSFLAHPGSTGINGQTLRVCGHNPVGR